MSGWRSETGLLGFLVSFALFGGCSSSREMSDASRTEMLDAPDVRSCAPEACDGIDGDCDERIDEEVRCDVPAGVGACVSGSCAIVACDDGRADCNDAIGDGCEAELTWRRSCGACGIVCGIAERCEGGGCVRERILRVDPELRHTVALLESGRVLGWGTDVPLPDGRRMTSYRPFELDVRALDVTTTGRTILAVTPSHRLVGWGSNFAAELGQGYLSGLDEVVPLVEVPTLGLIESVDAGPMNWIGALGTDGDVRFWGGERVASWLRPGESVSPRIIGVLSFFSPVQLPVSGVLVAGDAIVITTPYNAELWGAHRNGVHSLMDVPFDPGVGTAPIGSAPGGQIDCSMQHCCQESYFGLLCWGRIAHGALGRDVSEGAPNVHGELAVATPPAVGFERAEGERDFVRDIAAADLPATCALRDDDSLWCWGAGHGAGLGTSEDEYLPVRVPVEGMPTDLYAAHNMCVVLDGVHLRCWGDDRFGAIGRGVAGPEPMAPTAPVGLE